MIAVAEVVRLRPEPASRPNSHEFGYKNASQRCLLDESYPASNIELHCVASMNLSHIEESLLLAAFFRGDLPDQGAWTSNSDQILTLSLFYTGDISSDECQARFTNRGYVGGVYSDDGDVHPQIEARYRCLIDILHKRPQLIEGGGDFKTPAHPTYTACRLTDDGLRLIPHIIDSFPDKPDFSNWPDRRTHQDVS